LVQVTVVLGRTVPVRPRALFLGGAGVHYEERAPGPELAPWVAAFWRLRCERPFALRVLPDGCMDFIGGDVVGSLGSAIVADLEAGEDTRGVRLRPGAFTALYGVPASELADLRVPLADVVRPRSLLELAREAPLPDPLAEVAMHANDVRTLARETGYSTRNLHRRVLAATGHSPKRLSRIGRMQAVLASGRGESWARTAFEFGFHDESHMINDIRALANATPQRMLNDRFAGDYE
jgi:AraC-like DNA-binding protein